jgi:hypothetical protein
MALLQYIRHEENWKDSKALRYVFKDYSSSYTELRHKANKPLLYVQRLRLILLEVYKFVNKVQCIYMTCSISEKFHMTWEIVILLCHLNITQYIMEINPSGL